MEPRLELLIKLFYDSLDHDLASAAQIELESLLEDADLVDRFTQWQAGINPTDGADPGATPELDRRVRAGFNSRSWASRHWQGLLAAAVGLAGLGVFVNALMPRRPAVVKVMVDEQPLDVQEGASADAPEAEPALHPTTRPTLGLPPGYGQRPTRLEAQVSGDVELRWTMAHDGGADVRVLDAKGGVVRTVWKGHAEAGRYRNHWNGKDDEGRLVPPGSYRLQARRDGHVVAEQRADLNNVE